MQWIIVKAWQLCKAIVADAHLPRFLPRGKFQSIPIVIDNGEIIFLRPWGDYKSHLDFQVGLLPVKNFQR